MPLAALVFLFGASAAAQEGPRGQGDPPLVQQLDPLLARESVRGSRFSVLVARADDGRVLYALEPDRPLHPASNTKIVTTAAALVELGPTYTWSTELAADGLKNGAARELYLIGRGDPRFVSESLWRLVHDARLMGLTRVDGDLVVDDTFFTADRMAPGFDDKKQDSAYRAATGAMSLNFNSTVIHVRPGAKVGDPARVLVDPDSGYATVRVDATTTRKGKARIDVRAEPHGDRTRIVVAGKISLDHPGLEVRRRIDNPPLYAGLAAKKFLADAGIAVKGQVRLGAAPPRDQRTRLAAHVSPPLADVADDVNKLSNNFMAEHLVRTLGAVKHGRGDWESGRRVVERFLTEDVGLRGYRYVNGSGLFGDTAFSARQLVEVLRYMHRRRPALPEFAASLAIGGGDGTLDRRLRGVGPGVVRAKTGTLDGVICISGYVQLQDGTLGVFSLLMNDVPGRPWDVWAVQDEVIRTLVAYTPPG